VFNVTPSVGKLSCLGRMPVLAPRNVAKKLVVMELCNNAMQMMTRLLIRGFCDGQKRLIQEELSLLARKIERH
jgi:hypothetical protein